MHLRLGKHEFRLTWLRGIGLALLGVYLAHVAMPLYWHRPGADDCTFGPVTNAQYRELKRKANRELFWAKFYLPFDEGERARRIAEAMETVAGDTQSLFVRLAAMHAVMRALNGQHFRSSNKNLKYYDKEEKAKMKIRSSVQSTRKNPVEMPNVPIFYNYDYSIFSERFIPISLLKPFNNRNYAFIRPLFKNIDYMVSGKYKKIFLL